MPTFGGCTIYPTQELTEVTHGKKGVPAASARAGPAAVSLFNEQPGSSAGVTLTRTETATPSSNSALKVCLDGE
jgi:hypothetical protein